MKFNLFYYLPAPEKENVSARKTKPSERRSIVTDDFRTKSRGLLIHCISKKHLYRSKSSNNWQIICLLLKHVPDMAFFSTSYHFVESLNVRRAKGLKAIMLQIAGA